MVVYACLLDCLHYFSLPLTYAAFISGICVPVGDIKIIDLLTLDGVSQGMAPHHEHTVVTIFFRRLLSARAGGNGNVRTLKDAAELLQSESAKNVVVVAGAGISTPSGIPDFRFVLSRSCRIQRDKSAVQNTLIVFCMNKQN